jgi:hypothetical protein
MEANQESLKIIFPLAIAMMILSACSSHQVDAISEAEAASYGASTNESVALNDLVKFPELTMQRSFENAGLMASEADMNPPAKTPKAMAFSIVRK